MKNIKDFEEYQIDVNGTIVGKMGRILKPSLTHTGYLHVNLYKDGKRITRNVHRLMAETFIPNPDNLPQVNHINGDKTDNRVENLEWCTAQHNISHAVETGLRDTKGSKNVNNKLSPTQVLEIRELANSMKGASIGRLYGVTKSSIYSIIHRKTFK